MQSDARPLTRRVDYKIHGLTDACCRPIAFLLTGGQVADCTAADTLLDQRPAAVILHRMSRIPAQEDRPLRKGGGASLMIGNRQPRINKRPNALTSTRLQRTNWKRCPESERAWLSALSITVKGLAPFADPNT